MTTTSRNSNSSDTAWDDWGDDDGASGSAEQLHMPSKEELCDYARLWWNTEQTLRDEEDLDDAVLHNQHDLNIPAAYLESGRVDPQYTGTMLDKLTNATQLLLDEKGVRIRFDRAGEGEAAEVNRETLQDWTNGALRDADMDRAEGLFRPVDVDILHRSRAFVRVTPDPALWAGHPDEWDEAPNGTFTRSRLQAMRAANFPIRVERRDPHGTIVAARDRTGIARLLDFEQMSVPDCLAQFVDEDGEPLARGLMQQYRTGEVTAANTVTVLYHWTRDYAQVVMLGGNYSWSSVTDRQDTSGAGDEEMLWEGENPMGCVPYVEFFGRILPAREPHLKYKSFTRAIRPLVISLDNSKTLLSSAARTVAYPAWVLESDVTSAPLNVVPGGGDEERGVVLDMAEGKVAYLPPGSKVSAPAMVHPANMQVLADYMNRTQQDIDRLTLGPAASGGGSADSGYEYNQRKMAAENSLGDFARGLSVGWPQVAQMMLRAAKVLFDGGFGPIPVQYSREDAAKYVTLKAAHVGEPDQPCIQYKITAQIQVQPAGGLAAVAQVQGLLLSNNLTSHLEAMEAMGNENPARTQRQMFAEQFENNPKILDQLTQMAMQNLFQQITLGAQQQMPQNVTIPQAAAGVLAGMNDPSIAARLPQMAQAPAAAGGMPGMPGSLPNPAPPPPTPGDHQLSTMAMGGHPGHSTGYPGMAQATPGGINRQPGQWPSYGVSDT